MARFIRKSVSKGQASAPFELLIAVILMSFVLLAGFEAMSRLRQQTCENTINSQLGLLAQNIQNVATGKGTAQFRFDLGDCTAKINDCENYSVLSQNGNVDCIKLFDSTDPNICSSYCSSARSICSLIQYKSPNHSVTKCVDISAATSFPDQGSQQCPDRLTEGWELQNLEEHTIRQGTYSFLKVSDLTASIPVVCAYLRVG